MQQIRALQHLVGFTFTVAIITCMFLTSGSRIRLSWLTRRPRRAEAIYSFLSPDACPVGPGGEKDGEKERKKERGGGCWVTRLHSRLIDPVTKVWGTSLEVCGGCACGLLLHYVALPCCLSWSPTLQHTCAPNMFVSGIECSVWTESLYALSNKPQTKTSVPLIPHT